MKNKEFYSIAIDGPAASGKSTAAKGVAKELGFLYVDTGAMYRAFTLFLIEKGLDNKNEKDALSVLDKCDIYEDKNGHVFLNGKDVTSRVRENDVSSLVSYSCAYKAVREKMVDLQRKMARNESVVMDGRDIGTVVLVDADLKVYQTATPEARAKRRYLEDKEQGRNSSYKDILEAIKKRDYIDSHRQNSPLTKAPDAIELDTSDMSIKEETDKIISLFKEKVGK